MMRIIRYLWANIRVINRCIRILSLKVVGVKVDWTANVFWSAIIEPNHGIIVIGPRTSIDRGVIIRAYGGSVIIGSDCSLNPYTIVYGDGGLKIGNGVRIAAHTVIVPANHIISDTEKYIYEQGQSLKGIIIEDDVWLGSGVKVMDGVTIKKGSVIGAGAVVTKSTEPYGVYIGVPARKKSSRLNAGDISC